MCLSQKTPEAPKPIAPPPPPKPVDMGSKNSQTDSKRKNSARSSLSIPLNMGGTSGGSGLGIPK